MRVSPAVRDRAVAALAGCVALAGGARAQSVADRTTATDGTVQVIFPSRPNVCGDGRTYIRNAFGNDSYVGSDMPPNQRDGWRTLPCTRGPVRAVATVIDHQVTRIRSYVGPVPSPRPDVRTIEVGAAEAAAWLGELASRGSQRPASDAMLPLIVADAPPPWHLLLQVARDTDRPRAVRGSALLWLSNAVTEHLGIARADGRESDDDEMRTQAVFVLAQRPRSESVPELIELARTSPRPAARRAAIFWLGQSGDPRAADVYAELLGIR